MELRTLPLDREEAFQIARRDSIGLTIGLAAVFLATNLMKGPAEASPAEVGLQGFAGPETIYTVPAKYAGLTAFDDGDTASVELIDTSKPEHLGKEYVFDFTYKEVRTPQGIYFIGDTKTPRDIATDYASLMAQYCERKKYLLNMGGPAGEICAPAAR